MVVVYRYSFVFVKIKYFYFRDLVSQAGDGDGFCSEIRVKQSFSFRLQVLGVIPGESQHTVCGWRIKFLTINDKKLTAG